MQMCCHLGDLVDILTISVCNSLSISSGIIPSDRSGGVRSAMLHSSQSAREEKSESVDEQSHEIMWIRLIFHGHSFAG